MRRRTAKDYMSYYAPAIILTQAGFIVAYQFVDPAAPRHFTIATGRARPVPAMQPSVSTAMSWQRAASP